MFIASSAAFVAGFVASIYAWPRIKLIVNGAQSEATALRAKADAIVAAVRK